MHFFILLNICIYIERDLTNTEKIMSSSDASDDEKSPLIDGYVGNKYVATNFTSTN